MTHRPDNLAHGSGNGSGNGRADAGSPGWFTDLGAFLRAYLRAPREVGALVPSSRRLADAMTAWVDWAQVRAVVEFGPGTGAVTEVIMEAVPERCAVMLIERDEIMARSLQRRFADARVVHGTVERAREYCEEAGIGRVDAVISSLPWASLPPKVSARCLASLKMILQPHGAFATFAQIQGLWLPGGRRLNGLLPRVFENVERSSIIWRNAPPALVYRCTTPTPSRHHARA